MTLTLARLQELLEYDPETGVFRWKVRRGSAYPGAISENKHRGGYRQVVIDRKRHLSHRLAWFYVYGTWPIAELDHIDRDRSNNRLANLREATRAQNVVRSLRKNSSGIRGVRRMYGKWYARIGVDGREVNLGKFQTSDEASAAYQDAARRYFGEFSDGAAV